MDKINLDNIIEKTENEREDYDLSTNFMKVCMKEVAHQVLVLASENAIIKGEYKIAIEGNGFIEHIVDKQSILDIEKLIV